MLLYRAQIVKILVLGGTGNFGPHFVNAALARSHQVSVFSRGHRHIALSDSVEQLIGERTENLDSIAYQEWDSVLDIATFTPDRVRRLGERLGERIRHYVFISTVSVYRTPEHNGVTHEDHELLSGGSTFAEKAGTNKALCELEARRQFPGRSLILRPGHIVGPRDPLGFLTYWPLRMLRGGQMLVPGQPDLPFQCIDARDLAEFAIRLAERHVDGTFNVIGPQKPTTLAQMIDAAHTAVSSSAKAVWVPVEAIIRTDPELAWWRQTLFWSWYSEKVGQANIMSMSNERALAHGLTMRPLITTLRDACDWYYQQPLELQATFIPGCDAVAADMTAQTIDALWERHLDKEQKILNREESGFLR